MQTNTIKAIILFLSLLLGVNAQTTQVRIRAVGDIMLGTSTPDGFLRPPEKGSILKYIKPQLLDADLTLGNLEGSLCNTGETEKCEPDSLDCYVFRMPEDEIFNLESAGFDLLSLANNHVGDFGAGCATRTETLLDSAGIGWSGRRGTYASRTVKGVRIGFVAFYSGGNSNSLLDIEAASRLLQGLRRDHEILIVSIHGGAEGLAAMHLPDSMEYYMGEKRGHLIEFAHAMIDAGADLVFGHGPHVARAAELYRGRLIAYSLGNFATYGRFNLQAERRFGGILETVLNQDGELISARILSIEQKYWGVPFVDPLHRFAQLVDSLSLADLPDNPARFSAEGQLLLNQGGVQSP